MRRTIIAAAGATAGVLLIVLGFNLRFGGYGSDWWLSGPFAYLPGAVIGALVALIVDLAIRRR